MNIGDNIKLVCQKCQQETNHNVLRIFNVENVDKENDIHGEINYMIVSCCGCGSISFAQKSMCSEDFDEDGRFIEYVNQYPIPKLGFDNLINDYDIPYIIRLIYKQTCNSIANNDYLLAGIGLRAIIEAICVYEDIKGEKLYNKIDNLFKSDAISARDRDVLHAIRFMGNDAVHEMLSPTEEQVKIVIKIVENLLENKYCLRKLIDDNLDMPFKDYDAFHCFINNKLKEVVIGKELCIDDIWEKQKRRYNNDNERIEEYKKYLVGCKKDIINRIDNSKALYIDIENKYDKKYKFAYKYIDSKLLIMKQGINSDDIAN